MTAAIPQGKHISVGDHQMYVLDIGSGEPLMVLHGGGPGADGWVDFAPALPYFTEYRCIIPDLLQYGKSSLPHHSEPIWSFHAKYVDLLMEAMGIESANFVCSSVGGSVALAMAAEYPSRVKRIVLSGSTPTTDFPGRAPGEIGPAATWVANYYGGEGPTWQKARDLMAALEYYDPDLVPDETVNIRYKQTIRPDWLEMIATPNARGTPQDLKEVMRQITVPVLLLIGKYDIICPPSYGLYLSEMIQNSEVYVMDRTRHHPEEERPEDYSVIVKGFLNQTT